MASSSAPSNPPKIKGLFLPNVKSFNDDWAKQQQVDQNEWDRRWSEVCLEGAKLLATHDSKDPDPRIQTAKSFFCDFFGNKRQEEAKHFKYKEFSNVLSDYGVLRTQDTTEDKLHFYQEIVHPVIGRYMDAYAAYKQRVTQLCLSPSQDEKTYTVHSETGQYDYRRRYFCNAFTTYGDFVREDGEHYRAPYITVTLVKLATPDSEYIVNTKMPSRRIEDFFRAIEPIYQKVLNWKKGEDPKQFYYYLGLLAWHTAVAMPLRLGSTAVNECMIRALEIAKGFEPKPFKSGVTPDFRAYYTPDPHEFASNFYNLFEGNPDPQLKDPFIVETSPPASVVALESAWKEVKEDFRNKVFDPNNQNLVSHLFPNEPYPLVQYVGIPIKEKRPSHLRTPVERMEINWNGFDERRRRLELFAKNRIALLELRSKDPNKAKEDDRTEEEMIELRNKIEILKRPGGFEAIFLYVHSEWVDDSRRLDHSMKQIEVILYRNSPERIEQLRIEYNSKNEILSWLETLEPEEADKIYKKIWFASDINNYRLVMENGTRVLKNIKDQPQAPKQISNDTDKRPGI